MNLLLTILTTPGDPIFVGDFFGIILAVPISLFLAYWMSSVKNSKAVITGAFVGTALGFLAILGWASTGLLDIVHTSGTAIFFSSVLICSILGLTGAMVTDYLIASRTSRDYRRQPVVHEQ